MRDSDVVEWGEIIDGLDEKIERLQRALKQISAGAENQDIGHKEFRIEARLCADAALRED